MREVLIAEYDCIVTTNWSQYQESPAASFSRMTSPHLELTQAGLALFPLCEDYLPDPPLDYDQPCLPCGSQQRRVDSIIITLWSLFG